MPRNYFHCRNGEMGLTVIQCPDSCCLELLSVDLKVFLNDSFW